MNQLRPRTNVAIDVGGSGVRLAVLRSSSERCDFNHRFETRLSSPMVAASQFLLSPDVRRLIPGEIDTVLMGLSGIFGDVDHAVDRDMLGTLRADFGLRELMICDDATTAFFGAMGARDGTVSAIGTGVVTISWDGESRFRRIDGWGAVGGDLGGGFWIGSRGARMALEMIDGRRSGSELRDAFISRYGSGAEFARTTVLGSPPKSYVADFARDILDLAAQGESFACSIVDDAVAEVVRAIRSAERQLDLVGSAVCLTGNAAAPGGIMEERIRAEYERSQGSGRWQRSLGSPLDGAVRLLRAPETLKKLSPAYLYRTSEER